MSTPPPEKAKAPDAASVEGREDFLALVGELLPEEAYDPRPEVRRAWLRNPGFWLARAATGAGVLALVHVVLVSLGAGEAAGTVAALFLGLVAFPAWCALGLAATRDALAEGRALQLGDQLLRWGPRGARAMAVAGLHLLPVLLLGKLAVSSGVEALGAMAVLAGLFLAHAWFYAASEAVLTEVGAVGAFGRGLGLATLGIPRRMVRFFRRFRWRHLVRPPVGEYHLGSNLVAGFLVCYFLALASGGLLFAVIENLGLPVNALTRPLLLFGSAFVPLLAADYTSSHFGGHYLVFLAERRLEGEPLRLAEASGGPAALPPGAEGSAG